MGKTTGNIVQNTERNAISRPTTAAADDDYWHKRNVFSKLGVKNTTYVGNDRLAS